MSKLKASVLTNEEIEEELVNNDLISSGGVEDQESLQQMDLEEKKHLLRCIKQSKEDYHHEDIHHSSPSPPLKKRSSQSPKSPSLSLKTDAGPRLLKKPIIIDTTPTPTEFPPLAPLTTKRGEASGSKLKLPRRQSASSKTDSQDQCISLLDDDDENIFTKTKRFSLPFCVSDNAPPLPRPDRALRRDECPYYQMRGELGKEALRRMLVHHDSWKEKYTAEMRKLESKALGENIEQDIDDKVHKSEENGDTENDPYTFTEVTKTYSGPAVKKRESKKGSDNSAPQNSRTLQRRTSRDSDCEEVQPILKPEDPKLGEWFTAARPRNKRNRKQNSNQTRNQTLPDVEFEFDPDKSLWGAGRSGRGPQSPAPSRRSLPMPSVTEVPEEKVQCPICQRNFTLSTVENHAATCEGFSMDVEEGM